MDSPDNGTASYSVDSGPAMSVVIGTPDTFSTIATTVAYLAEQTLADRLQLVIVCPQRNTLDMPCDAVLAFYDTLIVETDALVSLGNVNAIGIRAATAPIIALAEDHCFPAPDWAAHLLDRHKGPWAAVGPVMKNANPENTVSTADFLLAYGKWAFPQKGGAVDYLPGHNSSYKREALVPFDKELEHYFSAEFVLHEQMRANGHRLFLEPRAIASHTNFSRWRSYLPMHVSAGRSFAASRSRYWKLRRRLVYLIGSPLIPLVRLQRILLQLHETGCPTGELLRTLPALTAGLVFSAVGEALGYAAGEGNSRHSLAFFEFHRYRHTVSGCYPSLPRREETSSLV